MIRDKDGKWLDTSVFRQPALYFQEHQFYCDKPLGSDEWFQYWYDEKQKCIDGVEIDGCYITGYYYFYLNYCPILKVANTNGKISTKIEGFPDFWDGDYNYFWIRDIAMNGIDKEKLKELQLFVSIPEENLDGGYNLIVGKSRRRGYSYKAASISACNYYTKPKSLTILGAEDSKYLYPSGLSLFGLTNSYINFINSNTAWSMPSDVVNQPGKGNIKASYIEYIDGIKVEKGFKSEIQSISFKDNPGAARGKDAVDVFFEESGKFGVPGLLKKSYAATEDTVKAGSIKTGMITVFGTSGELDSGSVDYADMFSRPEAFGFLPFYNTWDSQYKNQKVGFFHPANWNMEGFYDKNGNSDFEGAKEYELSERQKLIDNGATTTELNKRLQERPLTPNDAFNSANTSIFPVAEIKNQLAKVKAEGLQEKKGIPVDLVYENGIVVAKPILKNANPITSYHNLPDNQVGCVVIYEPVIENAPKGLYKIGYDPVRQDSGTSLGAIIVYKGTHISTLTHDNIVAEYVGRPEMSEDIDHIAEMLAEYYNTTIMHENEVSSVKNYFRRIKKLHLLALQPDAVISKSIKHSKVSRIYGCHMVVQLKDAAERYTKEWLMSIIDYDENENPIRNLDRIYSQRLLEELADYNRNGNFDLISALFMCMFQVQNEELDKTYGKKEENNRIKELNSMANQLFNRRNISLL